ncbi:hypothetical protein FS749_013626 [Ceratobasidium sp. UAMH 11750]|nr:hypothetical protein FS749_013626 [Ceratobasidium sp. UAMH 11750]
MPLGTLDRTLPPTLTIGPSAATYTGDNTGALPARPTASPRALDTAAVVSVQPLAAHVQPFGGPSPLRGAGAAASPSHEPAYGTTSQAHAAPGRPPRVSLGQVVLAVGDAATFAPPSAAPVSPNLAGG